MNEKITLKQMANYIARLIENESFELCFSSDGESIYIPYMLNDAIEYYFLLKGITMTGNYDSEKLIVGARIMEEEKRMVLVGEQEDNTRFTVFFSDIEECAKCYQYHRIAHIWVEGQEHLRRLVYMIGTMHDKYVYFEDRFCNEKEKELLPLICFGPFRDYSPIHESLDDWYEDTLEGIETMEKLAFEAGDLALQKLVKKYKNSQTGWKQLGLKKTRRKIREYLDSEQGIPFYENLCRRIEEASSLYPERVYKAEVKEKIENLRKAVDEKLQKKGFVGEGIHKKIEITQKNSKDSETRKVTVFEEHPFVMDVMEYDNFTFRIHLLIEEDETGNDRKKRFVHTIEKIEDISSIDNIL